MNVKSLQALAILALDSMESGEGPTGWGGVLSLLTGGVRHGNLGEEEPIVKGIVDAKNNVKSSPGKKVYNPTNKTALFLPTENWMEVEERRRLFWCEFSTRLSSLFGPWRPWTLYLRRLLNTSLLAVFSQWCTSSIDTRRCRQAGRSNSGTRMLDVGCLAEMTATWLVR